MTFVALAGFLMLLLIIVFKRPLMVKMRGQRIVRRLTQADWFQNHWYAGIFLFAANVALFTLAFGMLTLLTLVMIPYLHLLIMVLSVAASLYVWIAISVAWEGEKKDRLKMALVGSSWYLLLAGSVIYGLVTLEPASAEQDPFMAAVGFTFAAIVSIIAFTYSFLITGFWNDTQHSDDIEA